jgi:hypothetical protein
MPAETNGCLDFFLESMDCPTDRIRIRGGLPSLSFLDYRRKKRAIYDPLQNTERKAE